MYIFYQDVYSIGVIQERKCELCLHAHDLKMGGYWDIKSTKYWLNGGHVITVSATTQAWL